MLFCNDFMQNIWQKDDEYFVQHKYGALFQYENLSRHLCESSVNRTIGIFTELKHE